MNGFAQKIVFGLSMDIVIRGLFWVLQVVKLRIWLSTWWITMVYGMDIPFVLRETPTDLRHLYLMTGNQEALLIKLNSVKLIKEGGSHGLLQD